MKNRTIVVKGANVTIATRHEQDFISLTDMVKNFDGGSALIEQWLKNKDTVLFLGVWEQLNNAGFNSFEFEGIRNEAGRNSFFLSAKKWIEATGAIGLHAKAGRYGGTFAHKDIAFEFGSWLSPEFKLYLIKEFQRLKDEESRATSLEWSFQRTLSKVNYKIHTDAIKERLLPPQLRTRFPYDLIEPVPKGEFGGDALQRVNSQGGTPCGSILWEFKRTKNWSDGWLAKLREDQRRAKADVCVLVSQVLPKGVDAFDLVDGVWVTSLRAALPVATMLRQGLLQISQTRALSEGQHTKTEMVYQYLTGPRFKQRVEAIVEAFSSMQDDLDKERKVIMKQWAKRQAQIESVMNSTVGMYGDLQGIAGKSLQEIEGLDLPALEMKL